MFKKASNEMIKQKSIRKEHHHSAARRNFLKTISATALAYPTMTHTLFAANPAQSLSNPHVTDAPILGTASPQERVDYLGTHQAGILTPRPAHGMIAAFEVFAETPQELEKLFRKLSERIKFLTKGGPTPDANPLFPPSDSGILGPIIRPNALTITVGLGYSLFERRSWLLPHTPKTLQKMLKFPHDALNAEMCHGDISLQICANTQDTTLHALRDIIKNMPDQLLLRWKQEGTVPVVMPTSGMPAESARNFLGFKDGSANPDATDQKLMADIVWITAKNNEPDWALGGTYQAVRIIRNFVERWDRTPLQEQELIIGRKKITGAALESPHANEFKAPSYQHDMEGKITPHDAHIRLANPRNETSNKNLMLRRPFNYSNGVTKSGQLDQGLLFICYQSNLEHGFIAVQRRLSGEPLEEYIQPIGGGFFFILPGIKQETAYWGESLIASIYKHKL